MNDFSYQEYLKHTPEHLTAEDADVLYRQMQEDFDFSDEDLTPLWEKMIQRATQYAAIRASWWQMSREERMEEDAHRTMVHNSVISSLNIIADIERGLGREAAWRDKLGDDRKVLGDFACYIALFWGLNAR